MTNSNGKDTDFAKWAIFGAAIISGFIAFGIVEATVNSCFLGILAGLLISIVYPIAGAHSVPLCEELREVAFPGRQKWDENERAVLGALWPFSLVFWSIMALYFGIINRYYP